jgi:hypothetical protein
VVVAAAALIFILTTTTATIIAIVTTVWYVVENTSLAQPPCSAPWCPPRCTARADISFGFLRTADFFRFLPNQKHYSGFQVPRPQIASKCYVTALVHIRAI